MDDNEYYKMMRNQYSHHRQKKTDRTSSFTKWNSRQGREDAEMLAEKNSSGFEKPEQPEE